MIKYFTLFTTAIILCACTTPVTTLKNPNTGQVARCGGNISGSLAGGVIGYHIQKTNDGACVQDLKQQGFEETKENNDA